MRYTCFSFESVYDNSLKEMASVYVIVTITSNIIVSVIGVIGNVSLLVAFICRREICTVPNYFNLTTFVAGFIISAISYPLQGLIDGFVIKRNPECLIVLCLSIFIGICFTLNVVALTVERYISICHSLLAPTILTRRRVVVALGGIVVYAATVGLLPFLTTIGFKGPFNPSIGCRLFVVLHKFYVMFVFINFLTPIPVMIIIYCRIFIVLRRHIRTIANHSSVQGAAGANQAENVVRVVASTTERRRWKREAKSALFLFVLIVSFVVCWLPFCVFVLGTTYQTRVSPLVFSLSHVLVYSTATINPYLYGFGNKAFRQAVMSVFCKRCRKVDPLSTSVNTVTSVNVN
ncbi:alpha-1B adrenergic receptor-like [Diadema antillarum]|uniref:alpha-1B adrenergic receptor-like n=1 Tax=Diadema antillarum TaxID=105358 RepID=UPI003A8B23E3